MIINVLSGYSRLGQRVINQLIELGINPDQLIASVRDIEKAKFLADKGVSVRYGDFEDEKSLQEAFQDTDVLVLIPTFAPVEERIQQHFNALMAAKKARVKRIVFAGFITASVDSKFEVAAFMLYAESRLKTSGLDWTIVRNGRYMEEVSFSIPDILENEGVWEVPIGNAGIAYISRDDLAKAIAIVCMESHHSKITYELTGIKAYKMPELVEIISRITGRDIKYKPISVDDWIQKSQERGMNEHMIEMIATLYQAVNNGEFEKVTDHFKKLTGKSPESVESFLNRNIS